MAPHISTTAAKQRRAPPSTTTATTSGLDAGTGPVRSPQKPHPVGEVRYHGSTQVLRALSVALYFVLSSIIINATQFLGAWLYFYDKDWYYAYMSWTKQSFGLFITTLCQWWSPTTIRVSGDRSVQGQLRQRPDGRLECRFPERVVIMANHQLYTDWLYLWWIAYTNRMHGHIYIILKESLKYLPIIGPGMMFYGFIFLARNWIKDKPRFAHRLQKLKSRHTGPLSGSAGLDPMWLLMFPEGTNLSDNGRVRSAAWAAKQSYADMKHQLLPRSTGLLYCLQELRGTLDWVYDCTVAYEGIPRGQFGQDIFTIRSSFIQGRPPKSVNMYWRRFALSSIPLDDAEEFDVWLRARWVEKDELMELYMQTGRFPSDWEGEASEVGKEGAQAAGYIETEVQQAHWWEVGQIFVVVALVALVLHQASRFWRWAASFVR
ncbi:MAG: hypothetical protein M1838_002970 [Thelocarpon superellum]|nr:MAG: hypothetical protein M1838_002970 [Thelocarpon superellum]